MNLEIMKVGVFKGSSYVITHTDNGFSSWYCGYVEVPKNHIYFKQHYVNITDIECHGGLTYSGYRFIKTVLITLGLTLLILIVSQ